MINYLAMGLLLVSSSCYAVNRTTVSEQDRSMIRKMYEHVEMMRHEMGNHEAELRCFEDKLHNMEDAMEELRKQFDDSMNSNKGSQDSIAVDLKKLQTHANKSASVIDSYQGQVSKLEKIVQERSKDLDHLKTAVKSLMSALGNADEPIDGYKMYEVQPGDSLGVIAQKKNTTIRELKDFNHLKNDVIIVGQKLKIPDR